MKLLLFFFIGACTGSLYSLVFSVIFFEIVLHWPSFRVKIVLQKSPKCPELSYFLRKKKLYASCISMWLIPNFPDLDILLIIALRRQLRRVWIRYFYNHLHDILWLVDVLLNFLSPQAKRCGNIAYEHGIYNLPHELPNDLRLWKLGNIRKVSKPCIMIAQRPIALRRP